jgi:hypothetical protein
VEKVNHIRQVLVKLENEIYHVHSIQKTFENLYLSNAGTRALLMKSDSAVFRDLYIVYLNYVSIAVARLFDPEVSFGKKNLSLFYLLKQLKDENIEGHEELLNQLIECKNKAYNFTEPRN